MVKKADQERVKTLLRDTITLLCKNGLTFRNKFSIEAVIGVTLDEDDVFLVSMNEIVQSDKPATPTENTSSIKDTNKNNGRRKRKRVKKEGPSDIESLSSDNDDGAASFGAPDWDESNSSYTAPDSGQPPVKAKRPDNDDDSNQDNEERSKDIMIIKEELQESWSENAANSSAQFSSGGSIFPGMESQSSLLSSMNFNAANPPGGWPQASPTQQLRLPGPKTSTVTSEDGTSLQQEGDPAQLGQDSQQEATDYQDRMALKEEDSNEGSQYLSTLDTDLTDLSSSLKTPVKENASFMCDTCSFRTARKDNLLRHIKIQHEENVHYCTTCSRIFSSTEELRDHKKDKHSGYFICEECGKKCLSKRSLRYHKGANHSDAPPKYSCEICGKGFKSDMNYDGHMNKHHDLKPYMCPNCNYSFAYRYSLDRHIKVCKATEGPSVCQECGQQYKSNAGLKEHIRAVHEGKSYDCVCGRAFIWRSSLAMHRRKCEKYNSS